MTSDSGGLIDRSAMIERMKDELQLVAARSAVVTIDCQRGNLDPKIASLPVPDPGALEVVLHQAGLALDRAALERALEEAEG